MKVKQFCIEQDFEECEINVFVTNGDGRWFIVCSLSYEDAHTNLGNDDDYAKWLRIAEDVLHCMGYEVEE